MHYDGFLVHQAIFASQKDALGIFVSDYGKRFFQRRKEIEELKVKELRSLYFNKRLYIYQEEVMHGSSHRFETDEIESAQSFFPLSNQQKSRETSVKNKSVGFRNFACIDEKTNKFYLNLQALAIYEIEKICFISVLMKKLPEQNTIEISPQPFLIQNDISYFLLMSSGSSPEILKLLYMLSHSIYVTLDLLPQLESNISKAIDLSYSWNIKNYLHIARLQGYGTVDQHQTAAQSKSQKHFIQSENKSKFKKITYDNKLQMYFTQIIKSKMVEESPAEFQALARDFVSKSTQNNVFYTYESILKGSTRLLTSNKPLPIKDFYNLNISIAIKKLLEEALHNFSSFFSSYIEDGGTVSLKQIKNVLIQAKQAAISILIKHQDGWLGECEEFQVILAELKQKIEQETKQMLETIISKNKEYAYRILYNSKASKTNTLMGHEEINQIQISFAAYAKILKHQINELLKEIKHDRKEMSEGRLINNSEDFLKNLEIRIGIYQQKKKSCMSSIELAKKEQNSLQEWVYGLKIKLEPFDVISN